LIYGEGKNMISKHIKQFIKKTSLYPIILKFKFIYLRKFLPESPSASHNKRLFILQIAKENKIPVFIEIGTYLGDSAKILPKILENIKTNFIMA
jgi:predicted O-methyltransferase YrrM